MKPAILLLLGILLLTVGCSRYADRPDVSLPDATITATPTSVAGPLTPIAAVSPTPATTQAPRVIEGVNVLPVQLGDEVAVPENVALIVETGCWQCDGPTTGLVRVYRTPAGEVKWHRLFERPERAGANAPYISSFALSADASEIVVSVCSRGYCGGLGPPTPEAQTTLFRSQDGGVTWTESGPLSGAYRAVAVSREGPVLHGPLYETPQREPFYQLFPDRGRLEPPALAGEATPVAWTGGELAWLANDGRLLRSDGRLLFNSGGNRRLVWRPHNALVPTASGDRVARLWVEGPDRGPVSYYLGVLDVSGNLLKAFSVDFASLGGWLNAQQIIGNASVRRDQLTSTAPAPFFVDYLPAVFDLDSGRIHPIAQPFISPSFANGRNSIQAVLHGPFVRVVGTGSCLNVRAEPQSDARVLACAADNVLLKLAGAQQSGGGDAWLRVVTPTGVEGWASATYLER